MNNLVYGRTLANVRKHVNVRLVTDEKKLLKLASKSTYVSSMVVELNYCLQIRIH